MNLDLRLGPRLALQQRMTPQLILLTRLLTRPCQELRKEVDEALTDNPALEDVPDDEDGVGADMADAASALRSAEATITESPGLAGVDYAQGFVALHQSDELRLLEHLDSGGSDKVGLE